MTQKATVLRLLSENGDHGVSAYNLVYGHGITRAAAIVFDLKKDGIEIESVNDGDGKLARYVLKSAIRPPSPLCVCTHRKAAHAAGYRCMEKAEETLSSVLYCPCEKYRAAA